VLLIPEKTEWHWAIEMSNQEEVLRLRKELETVSSDVRREFGSFRSEQLNWKPNVDRWSVGQCLDHLMTGNKHFFPILDSIVSATKKTVFMERIPLLPGVWGKLLIKSLNPKNTRKMKARPNFQPASSDLPSNIVHQFIDQQGEFADWMDKMKDMDLDRIIITSPAMKLMTYSVMDGYRFLVLHEQRHLQQAQRVVAEEKFPK